MEAALPLGGDIPPVPPLHSLRDAVEEPFAARAHPVGAFGDGLKNGDARSLSAFTPPYLVVLNAHAYSRS